MQQLSRTELDLVIREARRLRAVEVQRLMAGMVETVARLFRRSAPSRSL